MQIDYARGFHEALIKAFAARAPEVRAAYFDLASFYHGKLPEGTWLDASAEMLRQCRSDGLGRGEE
jgi:hypothetical protein